MGAGSGEDPPHAGVGIDHLRRLAGSGDEHRAWLLGVGNDLFAFLVTYHQHGEQRHPTLAWLKKLVEHPTEVLSLSDPRHATGRSGRSSCCARQTTDTSIELYWRNGRLRSRHTGTPSVHIPIVEEFVDRMATRMDGGEGALQ